MLEKCILVLKAKKSFLGHEKLTEFAIKSNSAGEIALDRMIPLDKEHFRTVAAWDMQDSIILSPINKLENAFRVIYVDGNDSTQFLELSAVSRKVAFKWIAEIRHITSQNSVTSPLPSKRTSSLASKMSDSSQNGDKGREISKPRAGSLISSVDSFQTPESQKILTTPMPGNNAAYASPPLTGNKFKCDDFKLDKIDSQESLVSQKYIERKDSSVSEASLPSLQPPSSSSGGSDQFEDFQSFTRRRLLSFKSDLQRFEEERVRECRTNPTVSDLEDSIDHESDSVAKKTTDDEVSIRKARFYGEGGSESDTNLNSHDRISQEQFRSLYGSMQGKVQEYMDFKDRIDQITENIKKI